MWGLLVKDFKLSAVVPEKCWPRDNNILEFTAHLLTGENLPPLKFSRAMRRMADKRK
jgi:hypothetical protein